MNAGTALDRWLAVTREALAAPPELALDALLRAVEERARLLGEIARAKVSPPSRSLALELRDSEIAFQGRAEELRGLLAGRLEELRRVRAGTRGYRAPRGDRPTFLSRSV
jgi:hypothetical protein